MKKILIVYATAGIGHKKAAVAVKKAFDELSPRDTVVTIIDALDYTNDFFKWTYLQLYLTMVNKLPLFWGLMYYATDNFYVDILVSWFRRLNNWLNSFKLADYLAKEKFDVIISTHFFASEVVSDLKSRGVITGRLVTVVTDYRLHSWWVADHTDAYVVASDDTKKDLLGWRVAPEKIKVLGIPAEPVFSKALDRHLVLKDTGVAQGVFTVLVIGGGFGVGPIEEIVKALGRIRKPIQIVTICGNNKELVKKIEAIRDSSGSGIKVLGFVDNVYEYMEVSDIVISKSGGITMTESLIKGLPMIVISPIIGQETRNCDFLIAHGAGIKLKDVAELRGVVEDLLDHPEKLAKMKEVISGIRKPRSCYEIAELAIGRAGNG